MIFAIVGCVKQLAKLMIEYDLGVSTVATYKVKRIDSDFFSEDV